MPKSVSKRVQERAKRVAGDRSAMLDDVADIDLRWWRYPDRAHQIIFDHARRIDRLSSARRAQDIYFACLYDDSEFSSLLAASGSAGPNVPQTMTANIVQRQVNSFVTKIVKDRPLPMALTNGGNWSQQRRAKATSKAFEGVLDQAGYYKKRALTWRDGAIFGSGILHNSRKGKELRQERDMPWAWRVDPLEAMRGNPRTLWRQVPMDRLVLLDEFPKQADLIKRSSSRSTLDTFFGEYGADSLASQVIVEQVWHLPSSDTAGDGCFAQAVSEGMLGKIEQYDRDYFPISKVDFQPALIGWFGEGMVKQIAGVQYEINAIGLRLQEQGYMTGSYVLIEDGSDVETDMLDNGALTIVRYRGQKPEWHNPAPWHNDFLNYYTMLRGPFVADLTGASEMDTRGEKPASLDSGKALRVFKDITTENFLLQGREDERNCIDTAWQFFDLLEEIHSDDSIKEPYKIKSEKKFYGRTVNQEIEWDKVRMDKESFTLKVFPTNFLASTPEDRWSQVAEMAKAGLFAEDELLQLIDFPDVQRVLNLRNAPRRTVEAIIEKFLDAEEGKAPKIVPEPTMNLDLCFVLGTLAYLEAKWLDEAPEWVTAPLLEFVMKAQSMRAPKPPAPLPEEQLDPGTADALAAEAETAALAEPGFVPPEAQPLPAGAVAPEAMAPNTVM